MKSLLKIQFLVGAIVIAIAASPSLAKPLAWQSVGDNPDYMGTRLISFYGSMAGKLAKGEEARNHVLLHVPSLDINLVESYLEYFASERDRIVRDARTSDKDAVCYGERNLASVEMNIDINQAKTKNSLKASFQNLQPLFGDEVFNETTRWMEHTTSGMRVLSGSLGDALKGTDQTLEEYLDSYCRDR